MLAILGVTASGKDTIVQKLINEYGYKHIVAYTTRPMRRGEKQGINYHFISEKDFLDKVNSGFFAEYRKYETVHGIWYYGTSANDMDSPDFKTVAILTPSSYLEIKKNLNNVFGVYMYCSDETRMERLKKRGDNLREIQRRLDEDKKDFSNVFAITDISVINDNGANISELVKFINNAYLDKIRQRKV